jgi:hypothetical protein
MCHYYIFFLRNDLNILNTSPDDNPATNPNNKLSPVTKAKHTPEIIGKDGSTADFQNRLPS